MQTDYTLIRSDRRSISVEITREGTVLVRAPRRMNQLLIDAFVRSRADWIEAHLALQKQRALAHPEPDEEQQKQYRRLAKEKIPPKVAYYAELMHLHPEAITITGARTRFGSCSGKNRLSFSWRLMQYPDEAVDYVVVHELAHIRHKNHSRAFYDLIAQYLPDYKQREKLLRQ